MRWSLKDFVYGANTGMVQPDDGTSYDGTGIFVVERNFYCMAGTIYSISVTNRQQRAGCRMSFRRYGNSET